MRTLLKKLDRLFGRFSWYRDWRGGTWFGGGICVVSGETKPVPWERLVGNVDPTTIALIVRRRYFERRDRI